MTAAVRARVEAILRELLHVGDDEPLHDGSTLFGDLGVASIDLVNIHFRLEHEFAIRIGPGDLWCQGLDLIRRRMVRGGRLTPAGVAEVRRRLPRADLNGGGDQLAVYDVFALITVGEVVDFVARRLAEAHEASARADGAREP
jgi:acyl carrier protein